MSHTTQVSRETIVQQNEPPQTNSSQKIGRVWQQLSESKYFWVALLIVGFIGLGSFSGISGTLPMDNPINISIATLCSSAILVGIVAFVKLTKNCCTSNRQPSPIQPTQQQPVHPTVTNEKPTELKQPTKVASKAEYTEAEVIELVGQEKVDKWKQRNLGTDTYLTIDDDINHIYVLRYRKVGQPQTRYYGNRQARQHAQNYIEKTYGYINLTQLEEMVNCKTGNFKYQWAMNKYKLDKSYYWPYEIENVSGKTIYLVEDFGDHSSAPYWCSAEERYHKWIKIKENPEYYRNQNLIKNFNLETALNGAKDFACFEACYDNKTLIFHKVNGQLHHEYVHNTRLEDYKQKNGLEIWLGGITYSMDRASPTKNGYIRKLEIDHNLANIITTTQDYAYYSDGACVYLFFKKAGTLTSALILQDDLKGTLNQMGLKNCVLKMS